MSKLKKLREKANITQKHLAYKSGVGIRPLQYFEQMRRDIGGTKLIKIILLCNALGCGMDEIIEDDDLIKEIEKYHDNIKKNSNY